MTFVLVLILLMMLFGAGWLKGAIRAVCLAIAAAAMLALITRLLDISASTVIYASLAIVLIVGIIIERLIVVGDRGHKEAIRAAKEKRGAIAEDGGQSFDSSTQI